MVIMLIDYVVFSETSGNMFEMIIDQDCFSYSRYNPAKDIMSGHSVI